MKHVSVMSVRFLLVTVAVLALFGCKSAQRAGSLNEAYWLMKCSGSNWQDQESFEALLETKPNKSQRAFYLLARALSLSEQNKYEEAQDLNHQLMGLRGHLLIPHAQYARSESDRRRVMVAKGLENVRDPKRFTLLIMMLNDGSPGVRIAALSALKNGPRRDAERALPHLIVRLWQPEDKLLKFYASAIGDITGHKFTIEKWEGSDEKMIQAARKWAKKHYDMSRLINK